jgi:HK97 family phage major capsid protein
MSDNVAITHEDLISQLNEQGEDEMEERELKRQAVDTSTARLDEGGKIVAPAIRKGEDPLTSRPFMYSRAIRGLLYGWEKSKVERDVHEQFCTLFGPPLSRNGVYIPLNTRAMGESTQGAGKELVTPVQANEIIELLRDKVVVAQAGAQERTLPKSGQLDIPTRTGKATTYWIGEGSQITAADLSYGTLQLRAKKLAAFVVVSNELIADSTPGVEQDVRNDLVLSLGEAEDLAFLAGTGQNNQPTGISVNSNTTSYTLAGDSGDGATPDFDDIYNMIFELQNAKGDPGKAAFVMHPRTLNSLLKLKDSQNRYLFQFDLSQKTAGSLFGIPVFVSTQVAVDQTKGTSTDCSYIILGQFDQAVIARHAVLEIEASSEFLFQNDQTAIRAISRLDFGLRQPAVFVVTDGVRP